MTSLKLPESIAKLTAGRSFRTDDKGKSGSRVLIYDDYVLKIEPRSEKNNEMVSLMRWLQGRLPVPEVIAYETDHEFQYLLMSRIKGKIACDASYLEQPDLLRDCLVRALNMLWDIDISDCPKNRDLDTELKEAAFRVEHGLVDIEDAEPGTFGENGLFSGPEALLEWLRKNKPAPEPVFSHGDCCLPNILLEDGCVSGFIDLGDSGIADKWRDISLLYRSIKHNYDGTYGNLVQATFDPESLLEALGLTPDREKLRYYILLDELF